MNYFGNYTLKFALKISFNSYYGKESMLLYFSINVMTLPYKRVRKNCK